MKRMAIAFGVLVIMAGTALAQNPYPPIPPPQVETVPPPPSAAVIWRPGHWHWNGVRYVWQPGRYVARPAHAVVWVNGAWVQTGAHWGWVPGHWQ